MNDAGPLSWVGANLVTTAAYFALGLVVDWFLSEYGLFPAPIWLPASVATVAAMAGGLRVFPGIFLGSVLANILLFKAPVEEVLVISFTNAAGPMIGALTLRRLRPSKGLFTSFAGVIGFLICTTFLSPAISSFGGAVGTALGKPFDAAQFYSTWVNWWLTDGGGTLYLTPALILWLGLEREDGAAKRTLQRRDFAIWAWVATVSVVLFLTPPLRGTYIRSAVPFLLVVPLSWIALRMSLRSAYSLVTLVAIAATAGTVAGFGPFQNDGLVNPLQLVGVLVFLLAMNVLTIVSLFSEREDAQNANKVKSMFLATTSHELRTPLNAIIGYSSLIEHQAARGGETGKLVEYAKNIGVSGEHLLALINDLLDMSKIEAGRFDLDEEAISLTKAIEEAIEILRLQADAKSIDLAFTSTCGDVIIAADRRACHQILLNLLSNAIKFTPDKGMVGVSLTRDEGDGLTIRVLDTGIGIPADALERVFRPFERAHAGNAEGTGLGLSITRGLVVLHGGTITLTSTVGAGTEAVVTLPASRVLSVGDVIVSTASS